MYRSRPYGPAPDRASPQRDDPLRGSWYESAGCGRRWQLGRSRRAPTASIVHPEAERSDDVDLPGTLVELVVKVHRGIDECQARECLREVPQLLAGEPDLLGEQTDVLAQPVDHSDDVVPSAIADVRSRPVGDADRVHRLAVDVELELVGSAVPAADRR